MGKTSLITWLAKSSGNVCVRVNNHEHTDLQEYVGCYAADENGKLAFREGKKVLKEYHHKDYLSLQKKGVGDTNILQQIL